MVSGTPLPASLHTYQLNRELNATHLLGRLSFPLYRSSPRDLREVPHAVTGYLRPIKAAVSNVIHNLRRCLLCAIVLKRIRYQLYHATGAATLVESFMQAGLCIMYGSSSPAARPALPKGALERREGSKSGRGQLCGVQSRRISF